MRELRLASLGGAADADTVACGMTIKKLSTNKHQPMSKKNAEQIQSKIDEETQSTFRYLLVLEGEDLRPVRIASVNQSNNLKSKK